MTDQERIRRAVDDNEHVGDTSSLLVAEIRRLMDKVDRASMALASVEMAALVRASELVMESKTDCPVAIKMSLVRTHDLIVRARKALS